MGLVGARRLDSTHLSRGMWNWSPPEVSSKQHFCESSEGAQLIRASSCITSTTILLTCVTEQAREPDFPYLFFPIPQDKLRRAKRLSDLIFIKKI